MQYISLLLSSKHLQHGSLNMLKVDFSSNDNLQWGNKYWHPMTFSHFVYLSLCVSHCLSWWVKFVLYSTVAAVSICTSGPFPLESYSKQVLRCWVLWWHYASNCWWLLSTVIKIFRKLPEIRSFLPKIRFFFFWW